MKTDKEGERHKAQNKSQTKHLILGLLILFFLISCDLGILIPYLISLLLLVICYGSYLLVKEYLC